MGCAPSGANNSAGRSRSISASSAAAPASSMTLNEDAGEQVLAPFLQESFIGDGTRRHDAHHLAFHRTLGFARDPALLADRDGFALADQFRQVGIESDHRHAGHGNRRSGGGAALGERNIQERRGTAGIVVKHFVEIAHAIEQQHVGMLRLDAQVLLHHGGVVLPGIAGDQLF